MLKIRYERCQVIMKKKTITKKFNSFLPSPHHTSIPFLLCCHTLFSPLSSLNSFPSRVLFFLSSFLHLFVSFHFESVEKNQFCCEKLKNKRKLKKHINAFDCWAVCRGKKISRAQSSLTWIHFRLNFFGVRREARTFQHPKQLGCSKKVRLLKQQSFSTTSFKSPYSQRAPPEKH